MHIGKDPDQPVRSVWLYWILSNATLGLLSNLLGLIEF